MNRIRSFFICLFVTAMVVNVAIAQDRQQNSENSLLPEIDPQDIEIRSQFKARFPGLKRQPILGFDPTPRVYQIDPNRKPFMETPKQVVANLPVSELSRPDPPDYTPLQYSSDINAFGRLGIGSYISPEAQFWGISRINPKSYIGGDFDFSSSDGHLDNQQSSYRFFNANGEYATKLTAKSRLGLNGGFENSFNNMFDLDPVVGVPADARQQYTGFNIGGDFQHFQNTVTGWKIDANFRYFKADLKNASDLSGTSQERVFNGSVVKRWAGSNVNETFTVKLGAKGGNYDNNTPNVDKWLTGQAGVVYDRLFNYSTKVTADASVYYALDEFTDTFYLGPSVKVEHPLLDMLTLTVKAGAEPYVTTVRELHTENRFLTVGNVLRHTYRIHGLAEVSLDYADMGTLNFGVQYEDFSKYPIYKREEVPVQNSELRYYEVNYVDAHRAGAYASVSHQIIPERFWMNAKVYVQSPQINDGGRIPYEEKVGVNSGITVRPIDRLTFEAWADYIGSRKTFQTNESLDGFLLLGGRVDLRITKRFGAYAKFVNLLNQDYEVWQGYRERPFQAYGGVSVKL